VTAPSPSGTDVAFGVDVGGTKVLGVAVDRTGAVLCEVRLPTPRPAGGRGRQGGARGQVPGAWLADAVLEVVATLGREAGGVAAGVPVGVGVPGVVDSRRNLRIAPNLSGAQGADLRALLARALPGTAAVVDNDANLAGLAEHALGAARGAPSVLLVTLGTGIGGAVISGGRVQRGAHGFAGEVGHMLVQPSGLPCPCGRRGCWEQYASGEGLGRMARQAARAGSLDQVVALAGGDLEQVRGEHVTMAAAAGDGQARALLDRLGWWVAFGLANLVAVLDPARIVVGGGLAQAGELVVAPVRRAFATLVYAGGRRPDIPIVAAALGERAGAIGAALAARRAAARRAGGEGHGATPRDAPVVAAEAAATTTSSAPPAGPTSTSATAATTSSAPPAGASTTAPPASSSAADRGRGKRP